uniref:Uncharacterized protein n=1 Tax=Cucumis melo TaxID=3656 RepID=A0A9I9DB43_CUCME
MTWEIRVNHDNPSQKRKKPGERPTNSDRDMKAREKELDSKPRARLEGRKRENETHQNLGQGRLLLWGLNKVARIQVPRQK